MTHDQHSTTGGDEPGPEPTRRGLLRTASAAVVGVSIAGAASEVDARSTRIPELDFRGGVPPVSEAPQGRQEVVFHAHGYSESNESVDAAGEFRATARELGYEGTVAAVTWDDGGGATGNARETGADLAGWLDDFRRENPETTVRLLGYSMGALVVMEAVNAIDGAFTVANADMIGSYERADAPCRGSGYYDAIESSCLGMYNYWSGNDGIARLGSAGGATCDGAETPPNYADVDVTDAVGSHRGYRLSTGCVREILDNYEEPTGDSLSVSTAEATDVGADRATLSGRLGSLGSVDAAEASFQYREASERSWTGTAGRTLSAPGPYTRTVTGLADDTEYEFRAVAETDAETATGSPSTFATGGGGTDRQPSIDAADADAACYWRCYVDVSWSVSDPDGDLARVEVGLYEGDELTDAAEVSVSGGDASGTTDLRSGWFDDPDRVALRVVDAAGNATTTDVGL